MDGSENSLVILLGKTYCQAKQDIGIPNGVLTTMESYIRTTNPYLSTPSLKIFFFYYNYYY